MKQGWAGQLVSNCSSLRGLAVKTARTPFLSRLLAWVALLCVALTLGMGAITVQAQTSILAHIACDDTQLPDGGWTSRCESGNENGIAGKSHGDAAEGNDLLDIDHHHHAEVPSGTLAARHDPAAPNLLAPVSFGPEPAAELLGIDPSLADQPPKI